MNTKKTILLAAILAIAVLYLSKVMMPQRQQQAGQKMALSMLKAADIESIDVIQNQPDGQGERKYTVIRKPGDTSDQKHKIEPTTPEAGAAQDDARWEMPAVRGALVDTSVMSQVVGGLRDLEVDGPLDSKEAYADLSVYGLSTPELTTVVHDVFKKDTEIAFGKKNQYLSKRYVKISGRPGIYLAEDAAFELLNKSSADVRSKTPFVFDSKDVRSVLLASSQSKIRLEQPAVGEWKIVQPSEFRASNEDVEAFLRALQGVTVAEFIDGEWAQRAKYGFNLPRVSISIEFREGIEPRQFEFSLANANAGAGGASSLYCASSNSDTIFKLAADPSAALVKKVDDLRFKMVVDVPSASMERVVGTTPGGDPVVIAVSGVTWTVNGKDSDPMFVQQLLQDISALKAVSFPTQVPADAFSLPFLVLSITKKDSGNKVVTITVGKEFSSESGDTLRYVKSAEGDVVYGVRDVEAKRIVPHEEALLPTPEPTKVAK